MESLHGDVTELIRLAEAGEDAARLRLFEMLYGDLRRLAASRMRSERESHTLTPTALVHEAYLRLMDRAEVSCKDRGHFLAVAAQAMRRILVDHARARRAGKRGGRMEPLDLDAAQNLAAPSTDAQIVAIDEALEALRQISPRQSQVVELRYFGGLTEEEVAEALGVNRRTINRDWQMARAWLHAELTKRKQA
jgi:RNA polymerase sigma factor (TIGR02999 family)